MKIRHLVKPLVLISVPLGLGYLIIVPAFNHAKVGAQRQMCQLNLKQMAVAYTQYVADYKASPPVSANNLGWAELLQPYLKKQWAVFQCPAGAKTAQMRRTDYFYNARLANLRKVPFPGQTILFGDGTDNSGANAHLSELPFDWKDDESAAERRHWFGFSCAFVDGHVKSCRPQDISTQAPSTDISNWKITFAVR